MHDGTNAEDLGASRAGVRRKARTCGVRRQPGTLCEITNVSATEHGDPPLGWQDKACAPLSTSVSGSRHSRLRKDLVNLQKAVTKWMRQEVDGWMTLGEICDLIKGSPAAQHLREMHGAEFRSEEFVREVIERARRAR